ncbi:MAG: hypothetical protein ABH884_00360 [Candidatus Komeilibacteria bacterium]
MNKFYFMLVVLLMSVVFAENISIMEIIQKEWFAPTVKGVSTIVLIIAFIACLLIGRERKK